MKKNFEGIDYHLIDPTGNITVLVASEVSPDEREKTAAKIMAAERTCEQVGFVLPAGDHRIKMDMASGEFCGNAVMSAAALCSDLGGLPTGEGETIEVIASGCEAPVAVDIIRRADEDNIRVYEGTVDMPVPGRIEEHMLEFDGRTFTLPVVKSDGIFHIICETSGTEKDRLLKKADGENAIRKWYKDLDAPCLGIMFMDMIKVDMSMDPLVYAPDAGTLFWERSCASGSAAVCAYHRYRGNTGDFTLHIKMPGGTLVTRSESGHIFLTGTVRL